MVRTVLGSLVVRGIVVIREVEDGVVSEYDSVRSTKLLEGVTTVVRVCGVTVRVRGTTVVRADSVR
ncbi:MAG TPA: hypothetical protein PLZ55_09830 [bacterium]|nr:hypothetical protein [bacterium]HQO33373.1 hypothetical protein [bacterium]